METNEGIVLVVDDEPLNISLLSAILSCRYKLQVATSGVEALELVAAAPLPDLILLDVMMPGLDGYEVCRRLKGDPQTRAIPVIFLTGRRDVADETHGLALGAADYIVRPFSPSIVLARVAGHIALRGQHRLLEEAVLARTRELQQTTLAIVQRLGRAAEFKDNETGLHVARMSHYSRLLALRLGADEAWVECLFYAAPMHDIGKIGIPDQILLKQGKLDPPEWHVMMRHPTIGAEIIGEHASPLLAMAREIALSHHERWDGGGYPAGLAGAAIPLSGRIVAVADVFDALTSTRPYKPAWTVERAMDYIAAAGGGHLDPQLTLLFCGLLPQILEILHRYGEPEHFPSSGAGLAT